MAQLWGFSMKLLYVIQRALARWIDIYTLSLRARLRVWQFKISILHPSRVQDDKTKLRDDSTISPVTDQDLVRLFKNGHPKAFEEILNRYESKIYHFILRFFKNQELAEEMEQDVFMKVYEKLDTYNADMKFSTW